MTELGSVEFWERVENDPERLAMEVCKVDLVNLEQMLQKHPSTRAWVNAAHEVARIDEERARWHVTKARAEALLAAKSVPDPHTGKPKTVNVLDAEVECVESVRAATEELLAAQEKRGALRAMADALEDRKDMLIQIAAKQRQESRDYHI